MDAAADLSARAHQELEFAEASLPVVRHLEGHFLDPSQTRRQTRIKALRENWLRLHLLQEVVEAWVLAAVAAGLRRQVRPRSLLVRNALDPKLRSAQRRPQGGLRQEVVGSTLLRRPRLMQ